MSKSVKIIIISVMLIILGVLIGICFRPKSPSNPTVDNGENVNGNGNGNQTNNGSNNSSYEVTYIKVDVNSLKVLKKKSDTLTDNVEIIKIMYQENDLLNSSELQIYGKNNNSAPVEYNAELVLYDKDGNSVDYVSSKKIILPNKEFAISLNLYSTAKYASYALEYVANSVNSNYIMFNNIKHTSAEVDDNNNILVKFTNTANETIDSISFSCLLYKNGELVGAPSTRNTGVGPSESAESTCYTSYYKIDFDQYKIVLSSAYNYSTGNSKW